MSEVNLTEAELAARREANAKATEEALRLAEEQKARDAASGRPVGEAAAIVEVVPSLKQKLELDQFSDTANLRPRDGAVDEA